MTIRTVRRWTCVNDTLCYSRTAPALSLRNGGNCPWAVPQIAPWTALEENSQTCGWTRPLLKSLHLELGFQEIWYEEIICVSNQYKTMRNPLRSQSAACPLMRTREVTNTHDWHSVVVIDRRETEYAPPTQKAQPVVNHSDSSQSWMVLSACIGQNLNSGISLLCHYGVQNVSQCTWGEV